MHETYCQLVNISNNGIKPDLRLAKFCLETRRLSAHAVREESSAVRGVCRQRDDGSGRVPRRLAPDAEVRCPFHPEGLLGSSRWVRDVAVLRGLSGRSQGGDSERNSLEITQMKKLTIRLVTRAEMNSGTEIDFTQLVYSLWNAFISLPPTNRNSSA